MTDTLIFVCNADSGLFRAMLDTVHKLISPATYPCSLCAITYGAVSMRREWKSYLERLPLETRFYHRDEFALHWPNMDVPLPAILMQTGSGKLETLMAKADLDATKSYTQLMAMLDDRLAPRRAHPGFTV